MQKLTEFILCFNLPRFIGSPLIIFLLPSWLL